MNARAGLQSRFLHGLVDGGDQAAVDVRGTPHFSVEQRLAVYANAYRRRLVEALASVYERCARLLGEARFDALALAYVEAHPPTDRSLARYGGDFPAWLRRRDAGRTIAAGVATIDAGLRRAFDAADAEPLNRSALLALPLEAWPTLHFDWVPALALGRGEAAALERWREPDVAVDAAAVPRENVGPDADIAFWRRDGQTFFRSVATGEALLLARLRAGACLAEACTDDAAPISFEVAAPALLAWVDEGWVAAARRADDGTPA
ncbi:MAG: HvfC/BufC family peptide modification chaperone [Silanimonas sp.]